MQNERRLRFNPILHEGPVKLILLTATIWALAGAAPASGTPVVLVDTDRNGTVNDADAEGRASWNAARGAIFMANNDSDDGTREPDWNDAVLNGPEDAKDLAPIVVRRIEGLGPGDTVTVSIGESATAHVRLFLQSADGNWTALASGATLPVDRLGQGDLKLGLEGKTFRSPAWDGVATVTVALKKSGGAESADSAALRVAPWIMLPNAAKGDVLYVRSYPGRNETLISQLQQIAPVASAELMVVGSEAETGYRYNDIWMQDMMEIGYTEWPGGWMNVVLKSNRNKSIDSFPKDKLLGPGYGWFQWSQYRPAFAAGNSGKEWLDWYGNLEVTPPLPGYPMGRVYYGKDGSDSLNPEIVAMIAAQEVQGPPVALDVGWLVIKHVDEMICFLPVENEKGFRLMVPDTRLMVDLLTQWQAEGRGALPLLEPYRTATVSTFANNAGLLQHNRNLQQQRIEPMIQAVSAEFGLVEQDLVRVPFLMGTDGETIVPNMVNALVLNGHLIMADPFGPKVGGKDLIQEAVRETLKDLGLQLHFVDDRQYHKWSGNVHCATNVKRSPLKPKWWEVVQPD